ncbi:hypothetical protein ACF1A5_32340 [Streptomyces sp. NPDC014864]|uniref:hypothetical protein n=1 Tax=Streptomyces sp. NPDC014864 TaxID=3364924 RepID=UPI0036FAF654
MDRGGEFRDARLLRAHQQAGLPPLENNGEPAALYAWMFLPLAAFGPGPWAPARLPAVGRQERPSGLADAAAANA